MTAPFGSTSWKRKTFPSQLDGSEYFLTDLKSMFCHAQPFDANSLNYLSGLIWGAPVELQADTCPHSVRIPSSANIGPDGPGSRNPDLARDAVHGDRGVRHVRKPHGYTFIASMGVNVSPISAL